MNILLDVGGGNQGSQLPDIYKGWSHQILDLEHGIGIIELDARQLVHTPWLQGQFDAVYCSHTLEHFDPWDIPTVVAGIRSCLKPSGWAEIRVPDLEAIATVIHATREADAPYFLVGDGSTMSVRDLIYGFPRDILRNPLMRHKHGFTSNSMHRLLSTMFDVVGIGHYAQGLELRAIGLCDKDTPFPYPDVTYPEANV